MGRTVYLPIYIYHKKSTKYLYKCRRIYHSHGSYGIYMVSGKELGKSGGFRHITCPIIPPKSFHIIWEVHGSPAYLGFPEDGESQIKPLIKHTLEYQTRHASLLIFSWILAAISLTIHKTMSSKNRMYHYMCVGPSFCFIQYIHHAHSQSKIAKTRKKTVHSTIPSRKDFCWFISFLDTNLDNGLPYFWANYLNVSAIFGVDSLIYFSPPFKRWPFPAGKVAINCPNDFDSSKVPWRNAPHHMVACRKRRLSWCINKILHQLMFLWYSRKKQEYIAM